MIEKQFKNPGHDAGLHAEFWVISGRGGQVFYCQKGTSGHGEALRSTIEESVKAFTGKDISELKEVTVKARA